MKSMKLQSAILGIMLLILGACSDGSAKKLQALINAANIELTGKYFGSGCYCDGVTLDNNSVTYTYSFPGQSLGDNAVDNDSFAAAMKPVMKDELKSVFAENDGPEMLRLMKENGCDLTVVIKFDDRSYSIPFTIGELE